MVGKRGANAGMGPELTRSKHLGAQWVRRKLREVCEQKAVLQWLGDGLCHGGKVCPTQVVRVACTVTNQGPRARNGGDQFRAIGHIDGYYYYPSL